MTQRDQLMEILNKIQNGEMTPEEGLERMKDQTETTIAPDQAIVQETPEDISPPVDVSDQKEEPSVLGDEISTVSTSRPAQEESPVQLPLHDNLSTGIPEQAETLHSYSSTEALVGLDNLEAQQSNHRSNQPSNPGPAEKVSGEPVGEVDAEREILYWKQWWSIPFWIGTIIMALGAMGMYFGYLAAGLGVGFWLSWIPFFLGVIVMALSWQSRGARWLHVRIHQKPGEKPGTISISLPLPIGLASWFLKNFSHLVPGLRDQNFTGSELSDMLTTLGDSVSQENPFYVHVNGNDGEEVEVFIG